MNRLPVSRCRGCDTPNDDATSAVGGGDLRPKPGSLSICVYCGQLGVYDEDLTIRELTDEEKDEVARDPRIARILQVRAVFQRTRSQ